MSYRVLVIDDEKNIRMILAKCLSYEGYIVDTAEDGKSGIEKFKNGKYDIVLLDMKMPGLTGIDVLKELKKMDKSISVVMMTAFGTIESAVESMQLGAVDYIKKPFTPDIIRAEVKSVLGRLKLIPADTDDFNACLQYAKKCIINKEFEDARKYLMKALSFDTDKAEVYNLLGVLSEYNGDLHNAQKFYKMALCVDYSYEPANTNLQRTALSKYTAEGIQFGNMKTEEKNK